MKNNFFESGKISFVMDGSAGSSGKSIISSYLVKNEIDNVNFLMSAFTPNASHTVCDDDGNEFVFKVFCGGSQYHEQLDAVYIVDNAAFELDTLFKEIEYLGIPKEKVRISPMAMVVTRLEKDMEAGLCDMYGNYYPTPLDGTVKTGSTCSGSGAALAKKVMRNKTLIRAKDLPELHQFLYPMDEIINRLESGESGMMEIAQGFPLSVNHHKFAPHTTSRNVTVSNALNDAMIPPKYAGNLLINLRTFPIKIHSYKYVDLKTGKFLTWEEVKSNDPATYKKVESYSGDFYDDQKEISWDTITENSGSLTPIMECTTLTKLPRRIATFSKKNLHEAIKFNNTGGKIWLCVNFINYIDTRLYRQRKMKDIDAEAMDKVFDWVKNNIDSVVDEYDNVSLRYLGTGERIDDRIVVR